LLQSLYALLCIDDGRLGLGDLISTFVDLAPQFIFAVILIGFMGRQGKQG